MHHKFVPSVALAFALFSPAAFAESGFFTCTPSPAGLTNCQVAKSEVAGSSALFDEEAYHASYFVTYNFSCFPGGYDSNIVLHAGQENSSKAFLMYSDEVWKTDYSRTLKLEGTGPLQLRDTNPVDTGYGAFAQGCGLDISYTKAPSLTQTSAWLSEVQGIVDSVNATLTLSELIGDVELFYEANLRDPESTAGFLNSQIVGLRQPGASEADLARADAYESILKKNPLTTVLQPLNGAKTALDAAYTKGVKLKRKLEFAGQTNIEILNRALERAAKVLGKA